jgi:PhzF family phenazine biosynthesis protein
MEYGIRLFHVDTFTARPFNGNPATVCLVPPGAAALVEPRMQQISASITAVETVFLFLGAEGDASTRLRFFTRTTETDMCGHAAIAAAHVLATEVKAQRSEYNFVLRNGSKVVVGARPVGPSTWYHLAQRPALPVVASGTQHTAAAVAHTIGVPVAAVVAVLEHKPSRNLIVVLRDADTVVLARPQRDATVELLGTDLGKLFLTAARDTSAEPGSGATLKRHNDPKYDIVSRLFAPKIGIDEDAVSAASHTVLARFWLEMSGHPAFAARLASLQKSGRVATIKAFQASPRGGELALSLGPQGIVRVSGTAVTVAEGVIRSLGASHL